MTVFEKRLKNLLAAMEDAGIGAAVFSPSTDYFYLTGSARQPAQREAALLVSPERTALLLPEFEAENEPELSRRLERIPYSDLEDPAALLSALLPKSGRIAVGSEMRAKFLMALQQAGSRLSWCCADALTGPLRRKKDREEIRLIETAQHMAERALSRLLKEPVAGKSERELASRLMELRLEEGFDSVGSGIAASGPNTALPHHINGDRRVEKGDILMFDIGGLYRGYRADFTRTFAVGAVPEEFDRIYQIVLEAHLAGKRTARPGVPASQVDRAARQVIQEAGFGPFFTHRLGHGIGLDVHEPPFIVNTSPLPLETGSVFSCEPGIYLPGRFGVRIEDLLVLEEGGARSLNTLSKKLQVIPV